MAAVAYRILKAQLLASQGEASLLKRGVGRDWKGKLSPLLYIVAILGAFLSPWLSMAIYVTVALIWVIPDRRIERTLATKPG